MLRVVRFVIPLIILCAAAHAESRIDCSSLPSRILKQSVRYCVALPARYDTKNTMRRYPVLYFLHGLGEDEQTLLNTGGWNLIEDLRQQHKIGDFLLAAPEGKQTFYINSAYGSVRYSDFFLQEFIPQIETKYHVRSGRQNRAITGVSMGGYGALRFAFARPELFGAVSAQAAALITQSPEQLDAAEESGMALGKVLQAVFGKPIEVAHWRANDPFLLARKNESRLRDVAIYFNCGQEDDFGFERGAQILHEQLTAEHIKHEYHLYPGDHSMNYFLAHFGEVLEFHSRVFALQK
ncbi:MAG TPA: alpha/beta hydrolase family protein [Terriglobales bacterium]|nr:alpha/beta hydrolase family protein [Terriglobales bacterium]